MSLTPGRTSKLAWHNTESDTVKVRDKTNGHPVFALPRCVVCNVRVEPYFTPNGAKVQSSRCPSHERKSDGKISEDGVLNTIGRAGRAAAAAARRTAFKPRGR